MENLTKALLITAGVLMAIMLLTLLVIFWNRMSGYFTEKHDAKIIEQTVEFNNRFENYNGQTVRGNEIISVMNRVIDYNNTAAGIEEYDPVKIEIDLKGYQNTIDFKNNDADASIFSGNLLNGKISNADGNDQRLINVANLPIDIRKNSGISNLDDTKLQKLAAEIDNIVKNNVSEFSYNGRLTPQEQFKEYKETRAKKLKNILGHDVDETELNYVIKATKQYYQYMQFKRAMFECTGVKYNTENQRVNEITFEIVLVTYDNGTHVKFN